VPRGLALGLLLVASGRHSELGAPGLAASGAVFLIAGSLAGHFSERMRASHDRQERLLTSGLRLARLEDLDALPAALAEELEQALEPASVEVQLRGAPAVVLGRPAGASLHIPISARGVNFGSLTLGLPAGRSFSPEDRVVAGKLALQAAVAAENQRLLASERERAALHAELRHTRRASRLPPAQRQPDPGRPGSRAPRDRSAATRRGRAGDGRGSSGVAGARTRSRPRAHTQTARGSARRRPRHAHGPSPARGQRAPTIARRVRAAGRARGDRLNLDHNRDKLRIEVGSRRIDRREQLSDKLATARARVELIGGTLQTKSNATGPTYIVAELPLHPPPQRDDGLPLPAPASADEPSMLAEQARLARHADGFITNEPFEGSPRPCSKPDDRTRDINMPWE
jgi:hypothetical protein